VLRIAVRLYGGLVDFLPPARRGGELERRVPEPTTTKDLLEALGVPHTEVELVLLNGEPVGFGRLVADGDRLAAYPHFYALDGASVAPLRPLLPPEPRFVLDAHLGRLAGYLRMLGFDALYANDGRDDVLAALAAREGRVLLTRDRGLLKRAAVVHGFYVRSDQPERQLAEVVDRFELAGAASPFRRCMRCNGQLEAVGKAAVEHRLEPKTRRYYEEFARCRACGRVYWPGSHHDRMLRLVARVLGAGRGAGL
jgi:hypothetical protein